MLRSPAGFLVQSIRENYDPPEGFKLQAEKARTTAAQRKKAGQLEEERERRETAEEERERLRQERVRAYWDSLTEENKARSGARPSKWRIRFFSSNTGSTKGRGPKTRSRLEGDPPLSSPHGGARRQGALSPIAPHLAPCKNSKVCTAQKFFS